MNSEFLVRPARLADVQAITDIYNQAIRSTAATFDVEEKTVEDRHIWLEEHGKMYPVVVACDRNMVVGWGAISKYAERQAWEFTVEDSVYIHPDYHGRGAGGLILASLVDRAGELGYHAIITQIVGSNEASVRLHEKFGFEEVGVLREVGWKFGVWLDILLMQKIL